MSDELVKRMQELRSNQYADPSTAPEFVFIDPDLPPSEWEKQYSMDVVYVRADRIEALTEQLEAARADAKEAEVVEIDIRHVMMDEIEKAVAESPWVPAEYYMNEVVSDICDFLRSPRATLAEIEGSTSEGEKG
jgi:hypothetical protein